MSFQGKYALVTGSSRGIGRGIAIKLAQSGAKVAVHYYQNQSAAEVTLARIRECGSEGFIVQADVCRMEEITRMFGRVKSQFGALDIFVSNARTEVATFYKPPMEIGLHEFDTAINSQAKAFLVGVREASQLMRDGGRHHRDYVCAGRHLWQLAAVGGNGCGESGHGSPQPLFCCCTRCPANHGQHH